MYETRLISSKRKPDKKIALTNLMFKSSYIIGCSRKNERNNHMKEIRLFKKTRHEMSKRKSALDLKRAVLETGIYYL